MCILFIAIEQHPDYPLIICANRDEFYARPTEPVHFWPTLPSLLAGKDRQAGGTWLGVDASGSFAAVTNLRTGQSTDLNAKSRGQLILDALKPNSQINETWLKTNGYRYNPFNLVYGDVEQLYCYNSALKQQMPLTRGFHAVSNGAMDDIWPKMARGKCQLEKLIANGDAIDAEQLFAILQDQTQAKEHLLPQTGISPQWEKLLSSIFIQSESYGTRSSTIVLLNGDGQLSFYERQFGPLGKAGKTQVFQLTLAPKFR